MLKFKSTFLLHSLFLYLAIAQKSFSLSPSEYAKECESAGIDLPKEGQLSCSQGKEIPIYVTDCTLGAEKKKITITEENFGKYARPDVDGTPVVNCDSPGLLTDWRSCVPGSRIQRFKSEKRNSVCVLLCRRGAKNSKEGFYDINMICNNSSNGATCFFNSNFSKEMNGNKLPSVSSDNPFWQRPDKLSPRCTTCHDNDPFVVSPWLQNDKLDVVPSQMGSAQTDPKKGPYWVVGSGPFATNEWSKRMQLVGPEVKQCNSCHRIGSEGTCGLLSKRATVPLTPKKIPEYYCNGESNIPWMPPGGGGNTHEVTAHLKKCCEAHTPEGELLTDGSNGCQWIAIPGQKTVRPETPSPPTGDNNLRQHQILKEGDQKPTSLRDPEEHAP